MMPLAVARALLPIRDRRDWVKPHLTYLPTRLYRFISELSGRR